MNTSLWVVNDNPKSYKVCQRPLPKRASHVGEGRIQMQNNLNVNHSDFVEGYNKGNFSIDVDNNKSGFLIKDKILIPERFRKTQAILRTISLLSILIGIIGFFFWSWWISIVLIIIGAIFARKAQNHSAKAVLEAALENARTYEYARNNDILRVRKA